MEQFSKLRLIVCKVCSDKTQSDIDQLSLNTPWEVQYYIISRYFVDKFRSVVLCNLKSRTFAADFIYIYISCFIDQGLALMHLFLSVYASYSLCN